MNNRVTHILEVVWISLAVLGFLAGVYNWYMLGPGESAMFFVIAVLSVAMYFYRRNLRRSGKK